MDGEVCDEEDDAAVAAMLIMTSLLIRHHSAATELRAALLHESLDALESILAAQHAFVGVGFYFEPLF